MLPSEPALHVPGLDLNLVDLYKKYHDELYELGVALRPVCYKMNAKGYGTTFADVDGELLYILVRETKPKIVFEISPNAGWSTNYMLAALTKNNSGTLHSFDVLPHIFGTPTEQVIRGNQCSLCSQDRLQVHIGDARDRIGDVQGTVEFALMDSCHDRWFSEWYVEHVFPRVKGLIVIQDIANVDRRESSSEAAHIWQWLHDASIAFSVVGRAERVLRTLQIRDDLPIRRMIRSNSVLLAAPYLKGELQELERSPDIILAAAKAAIVGHQFPEADRLLNTIINAMSQDATRVNRHRFLMKAAELYQLAGLDIESVRACSLALGVTLQSDLKQRIKGLPELCVLYLRQHRFGYLFQTLLNILAEPRLWKPTIFMLWKFTREVIGW